MTLVLEIESNETNHKNIEIERKYSQKIKQRRIIMTRELRSKLGSLVAVCCDIANGGFAEKTENKLVLITSLIFELSMTANTAYLLE